MNRDDIIRMARDSGMFYCDFIKEFVSDYSNAVSLEHIERFAALVAATEREACAKIVKETPYSNWFQGDCLAAIRARGNQ